MVGGLARQGTMGWGHGLDPRAPGTFNVPPVLTFGKMPFLLLIFVLEELFELLGVLHVGAAVRLWVKHTQPGSPPNLVAMVLEEFHFLLGEGCHGD